MHLSTVTNSSFEALLRGVDSFGNFLEEAGFESVPSPTNPGPDGDAYFSGQFCRWLSYLSMVFMLPWEFQAKAVGGNRIPKLISYTLSNVLYRYIPATLPVVYRCVQHHSKLKAVEYLCSWKLRLFTGGYNTRIHGSFEGGQINAIQIESARDHREDPVRDEYAQAIAAATVRYLDTHYP